MSTPPNDWQLECTELKQRGAYLLQSGQWSDCTFLVGTEPHQMVIAGHKLILAMASPVFEAMFYGGMAERNEQPIPILDVQIDAFKALLEYIYTGNINISSFDKACELCYGAKKYMLPHLVKECTTYLWSDLYPRNACRAYEFARLFEENVLMEKCIQIISTNTKEVLTDSSFDYVELNTVITVFSLDHLNIDSELDLFEAAERYAKAMEKRNTERSVSPPTESSPPSVEQPKSPAPSTSKEKVVNVESSAESSPEAVSEPCTSSTSTELTKPPPPPEDNKKPKENKEKLSIRSAVEKIRFLTLPPEKFAVGPARSALLSESEAFAVLMNILSPDSDVPMPPGFSPCRVPRKQLIGGGPPCIMGTLTVDTPSPVAVEQLWAAEARPAPARHFAPFAPPAFDGGVRLSSSVHGAHGAHGAHGPHGPHGPHFAPGVPVEHLERHGSDAQRIYCQRAIVPHTDWLNTSVLDCSVTFMVDKNICLLGVQVPTQAPSEGSAGGGGGSGYSELLYAHLLDADGARLTYTHYTSRVPYRHLLDIMFNRPVYIQRNKVYKVGVVFNKTGWYPMGTCTQQVAAESVFFNFGVGQSSDSVRDGLIRSIIFTY